MAPLLSTDTFSGVLSWLTWEAETFGRSILTAVLISGAVTMNTISSTSITSTKGVTLISANGL